MPALRTSVRYAHIEALVERGLIEFTLIDPGSANFTLTTTTSAAKPAGTYMNPEDHVRYVLDFTARHGLHPDFAIYEPGFMRAGAVLARAAGTNSDLPFHVLQPACGRLSAQGRMRSPLTCRSWRRKRPVRPG
jgi:hypothetical protein